MVFAPRNLLSLTSFTSRSPSTHTMTGAPSALYTRDFTNAEPGTPMNADTWSIVFAPGVGISWQGRSGGTGEAGETGADPFPVPCSPFPAFLSAFSIKEISPGCSLEGLTLKLKLQYFGHLMRSVDSLEKTLTPSLWT